MNRSELEKIKIASSTKIQDNNKGQQFFENLQNLVKAKHLAKHLGISVQTIYNWHHHPSRGNVPPGMFVKINRMLFVRLDVFRSWVSLQNSEL